MDRRRGWSTPGCPAHGRAAREFRMGRRGRAHALHDRAHQLVPRALGRRRRSARGAVMHGIGLRRRHYQHLLDHGPGDVDFFEIISEDFFADGGRPWHVLEQLRRDRPIVMHGVSMGIGDADDLSESYLRSLERVIARVDPAWVSDHICWVSSEGRYGHELWPLPYDGSTLDHLVSKIVKAQERLGRQMSFENPSRYTRF